MACAVCVCIDKRSLSGLDWIEDRVGRVGRVNGCGGFVDELVGFLSKFVFFL